jgi:hypothetical protein
MAGRTGDKGSAKGAKSGMATKAAPAKRAGAKTAAGAPDASGGVHDDDVGGVGGM